MAYRPKPDPRVLQACWERALRETDNRLTAYCRAHKSAQQAADTLHASRMLEASWSRVGAVLGPKAIAPMVWSGGSITPWPGWPAEVPWPGATSRRSPHA